MAQQAKKQNEDAFNRALKQFDDAKKQHGPFVEKVEQRYKSYRGLLDQKTENVQEWTSKSHPPYIQHIVETTLASLIDDNLTFRVRPRLTIEMMDNPQAAEMAEKGAKAHQALFEWQLKRDYFNESQRPFVLQQAIAGLTVAKNYWRTESQKRRHLVPSEEVDILTGVPGPLQEEERQTIVYDGPTTDVVDVRDFLWHEAAVSLEAARYVIHRVWKGKEDIQDGLAGDNPVFGPERGGWTSKEILTALGEGTDQKDEFGTREQTLFAVDRTKDLIAVVEVWDNVRKEVTTIANQKALLSHRPFPFWHNRPPFVICSTQPDLFRIPGISQVEKVAHLQTLLWEIQNQRIDNLRLINNAIFMYPDDVENIDDYDFEPGARWPFSDPKSVQPWVPNVIPAEVSLGAEGLLKGDLQNLAGGFPFSSGTDSQTVDQKTATGASIVTSIAQRSVNLQKQQVNQAWQRVGDQRMLLNQQFVREDTVIPIMGPDGKDSISVIEPLILQGDFDFEVEPVADAVMRQEDQAAAQAMIQLAASLAPIMAALSQSGVAPMLNMKAFVEDLLKAFGKNDTERYFSQMVPQQGLGPQGQQAPPGAPQGTPQGLTGVGATDPAVSPSAPVSQAANVLMQRYGAAANGGGTNI